MVTKANSATAIVDRLDVAEIKRRLDENEAERKALLVLLRAAVARNRPPKVKGASDAK